MRAVALRAMRAVALLLAAAPVVRADIYLHNPRGSNNRLDRGDGNTENANRLFDSQNNNAGGYGMGGTAAEPAPPMHFIAGSELTLEWTAQHSCGNANARCQFIVQYYCNDEGDENVRDGTTTTRIDIAAPGDQTRGLHEPVSTYTDCQARERNKGLWTADQAMNNRDAAINTRQQNNGANNRYGFECPEERDYYPYWHPSVWKDVAVLTTEPERCEYYKAESHNVAPKNVCSDPAHNNARACEQAGADWQEVAAHDLEPPLCLPAPWLRDNHLGNGVGGHTTMFNWTIPHELSDACVLRVRYNISTRDVPWELDSRANDGNSPVKTDPRVDVGFGFDGGEQSQLSIALNTDQHGRTFQDRTFRFRIVERPRSIGEDEKIYNLNVRGKRGNIVQTYPAVEYDFAPSVLSVSPEAWVHFQWTGNDNTQNNGANNGEGTDGTDRSNIVQLDHAGHSLPLHKDGATMFDVLGEMTLDGESERSQDDLAREFALLRQTGCARAADDPAEQAANNCEKLNRASPTIDLGLLQLKPGTYNFISTRNNNFSNRSQKGVIHVQPNVPSAPLITQTEAVGVDGVLVLWAAANESVAAGALDASKPEQISEWRLELSDDGGDTWDGVGTFEGNVTNVTVDQLPAGITHAFRVRARNADGWSAFSEVSTRMTRDSDDSLRYKELLRLAARPREIDEESLSLGVALGAAGLVVFVLAYVLHTRGTLVPGPARRLYHRLRPQPRESAMEVQAIMAADEGGAPAGRAGKRPAKPSEARSAAASDTDAPAGKKGAAAGGKQPGFFGINQRV